MIYELTEKGKKMWPDSIITQEYIGSFALALDNEKTGHRKWIADGPLEIEALLRLELIQEIDNMMPSVSRQFTRLKGCRCTHCIRP